MIGVINSPSKKGILDEAKSYSDTKLTEANKYTDNELAKIPASAIKHKQTGTFHEYPKGGTISLSGFTDASKMIAIVNGNYVYQRYSDLSYSYQYHVGVVGPGALSVNALGFTSFTTSLDVGTSTYNDNSSCSGVYTVIEFY